LSQNAFNDIPGWVKDSGEADDVVVSGRIRLARNLKGLPFPNHAGEKQLAEVNQRLMQAIQAPAPFGALTSIPVEELSANERMVLVEKHLCSPQFVENPHLRTLIVNREQTISIMVNEEDHLRLQSITAGFALENALDLINQVDDYLEEALEFCFDEGYGYLTACPTNVGTGIRASVMLHLPALTMVDQIKRVLAALTHIGINVRGFYGEGTEAFGDLFQISNQVTLGHSEEDLTNNLKSICRQVIEQERSIREALLKESRIQLEDKVFRSFGLLTQARLISSQDALKLLSDVKLGVDLGIIPNVNKPVVKELMFITRSAMVQRLIGKELSPAERDYYRAAVIRSKLSQAETV
jgi:protein arginine kinase